MRVLINGVDTTAFSQPLYVVSVAAFNGDVSLMSTTGYVVSITPELAIAGLTNASFPTTDCSGPAYVSAVSARPGVVAGLGNGNQLFYVPFSGATLVAGTTPQSRSTAAAACVPFTTTSSIPHYLAPPNNPAVTGISLPARPFGSVATQYVP